MVAQHSLSRGISSQMLDVPTTDHFVQAHVVTLLPTNGEAFQNPKLYAPDEYGVFPVMPHFSFTFANIICHS